MLFSLGVKVVPGTSREQLQLLLVTLWTPQLGFLTSHGLDLSGEFLGELPDIESVGWNI